jgi:hypothetical protein
MSRPYREQVRLSNAALYQRQSASLYEGARSAASVHPVVAASYQRAADAAAWLARVLLDIEADR